MKPLISEFSYGYAVTDELIHGLGTPITAAPVFPSLYQEGKAGGGYDMMLKGPAVPLFIQFKVSHCLKKGNAAEAKDGFLATPYYRMHLRSAMHSNQHQLLLELESGGNEVFYCAPAFHKEQELNDAYLNQKVCARSIWLLPSSIGPLPDAKPHYASFQNEQADHFYFCSDPQRVSADVTFAAFVERVLGKLTASQVQASEVDSFATLADELVDIASSRHLLGPAIANERRIAELQPVERASVLATVLFDSHLYIARLNEAAGPRGNV
ncbi:MAG: hypothetical protein IH991_15535 [Planctomycetes bacterium]|nr:hypothetical protein [Planctomycetota bacterium]